MVDTQQYAIPEQEKNTTHQQHTVSGMLNGNELSAGWHQIQRYGKHSVQAAYNIISQGRAERNRMNEMSEHTHSI